MARRLALPLVVPLLLAAACGGGGDDGAADAPTTTAAPAVDEGSCDGTDLSFTNLTTGESVDITSTGAVSLSDGAAYTAYLADFPLRDDDFGIAGAEVPSGGNLIQVAVTIFNADTDVEPLEAGTEIEWSAEFGVLTFAVLHQQSSEAFGNNLGAAGSLTVTAVGDTFCAELDYADDEKELTGTLEAEVVREL